jgi:hypothetical protein
MPLGLAFEHIPRNLAGATQGRFADLGEQAGMEWGDAFERRARMSTVGIADVHSPAMERPLGFYTMKPAVDPREFSQAGVESGKHFSDGFEREVLSLMPRSIKMIAQGLVAAGIVELGKAAIRTASELAVLGGRLDGIERGFEALADSPDAFMRAMREASRGSISDMELMRAANRAMVMGIAEDQQTLVDMIQVSRAMSEMMGIDIADYFHRLTNALTSLHPVALRNLGISVSLSSATEQYAKSLGLQAKELDESQKKAAVLAAILQDPLVRNLMDASENTQFLTERIQAAGAAKENFRQQAGRVVGELIEESGAIEAQIGFFGGLTAAMREFNVENVRAMATQPTAFSALLSIPMEFGRAWAVAKAQSQQELYEVEQATDEAAEATRLWYQDALDGNAMYIQSLGNLKMELKDIPRILDIHQRMELVGASPEQEIEILRIRQKSVDTMLEHEQIELRILQLQHRIKEEAIKRGEALNEAALKDHEIVLSLQEQRHLIGMATTAQIKYWQAKLLTVSTVREHEQILLNIARLENQLVEEGKRAAATAAREAKRAHDERMRQIEAERRELESMVSKEIKLTQVTREDTLRTGLGIYRDKPDEYIRRLRSAVQDEKSLWKDLLEGREGAAAELYLLEQEEAFRSGAWHQLGPGFDREEAISRIVENVRAQIEAQRHMQSLINEIMARPELAGIDRRTIERAVGLPEDYRQTGTDNVRAFAAGLESGVPSAIQQLNDSFEEEFTAQEERWFTLGEMSVVWFTRGIEAGQHQRAVDALVGLIAPRVAERLQGRP